MIYFDSQLPFCFIICVLNLVDTFPKAHASVDFESDSPFKEGIHNGKFVIYDHLDRQMVESSLDQMIADAQKGAGEDKGKKRYGLNEAEDTRGSKRARIEEDDE